MRAFLLAASLFALSTASAQRTIEYGTLVSSTVGYGWEDPRGAVPLERDIARFASRLNCRVNSFNGLLNCLGRQGWDLAVSYQDTSTTANGRVTAQVFVFKRVR